MTPADNTHALVAARKQASADKRAAVVAAIERLLATGVTVSFARVAREASVSQGLVHSSSLKQLTLDAIARQAKDGVTVADPSQRPHPRVSPASLKADLSLAREQVAHLRDENRKLTRRLERALGAELEHEERRESATRAAQLEAENRRLAAENAALTREHSAVVGERDALQADLTALRASYAALMRRVNSP